MADTLVSVLLSVGATSLLWGPLAWLAKGLISERLKNAVASEYAHKLEAHKAELKGHYDAELERMRADIAQVRAMEGVASSAFTAVHGASVQRQFEAVEAIWAATLRVRDEARPLTVVYDYDPPDVLKTKFYEDEFLRALADSAWDHVTQADNSVFREPEKGRLFLGEVLWAHFTGYVTLVGCVESALSYSCATQEFQYWADDEGVQRLLPTLLSTEEADAILKNPVGGLQRIHTLVVDRIFSLCREVTSGHAASEAGVAQAMRINAALSRVNATIPARVERERRELAASKRTREGTSSPEVQVRKALPGE